ncbi:hypothetical protein XELAEV_18010448mg [Xenopus laevis]|uniref:Secreted protein n=1 Tax=Xenopus laevis TaxID=8355 RepID=A0A974DVV7_XENLA|nr:hypothetical protein XELAEV_18010448mg [Xenopus laevis]
MNHAMVINCFLMLIMRADSTRNNESLKISRFPSCRLAASGLADLTWNCNTSSTGGGGGVKTGYAHRNTVLLGNVD